mmetsp:Transcript_11125/g.24083  ORF Transcript_11125/g.24083 Transcript_11125/m.24083 type:complete len:506 (-) Transcript_11125:30-1547(-)
MTLQVRRILGQSLLVGGSAVGAGLLALPAVTYQAGVVPSCAALLVVWMYMFASSLLLIETASCMDPHRPSHLLSMAGATLGNHGRRVCFSLYLVVYSATMCAYCAEGGRQAVELFHAFAGNEDVGSSTSASTSNGSMSGHDVALCQILFAGTFGFVIYRGASDVEMFNSVFMVGAIVSFCSLVHAVTTYSPGNNMTVLEVSSDVRLSENATIVPERRTLANNIELTTPRSDWSALPGALPILVVAFSYHNMVSSVFSAVERNIKECALSILFGSGISCVMYVLWLIVTLGHSFESSVNEENIIAQVPASPLTEEAVFEKLRQSAGLALPLFSFFALVTSVLGVGLGCVDFMEEALQPSSSSDICTSTIHVVEEEGRICPSTVPFTMTKGQKLRMHATLLTFCPPLLVAIAFPKAFLPLLRFSGVFRLALFGAMPVAMAWKCRKQKLSGKSIEMTIRHWKDNVDKGVVVYHLQGQMLPGGNVGLFCVLAMTIAITILQLNQWDNVS